MKHKILILGIIMMLLASVAFADGNEKDFGIILGGVFQTHNGTGDLPFVGFDAGLAVKVYDSVKDHDMWVRFLYQRTWPFNIATPEFLTTYIRNTLSVGPEFVFNKNDFILGLAPGLLYRMTQNSNGSYTSGYGLYVEGFADVEVFGEESWFVVQPYTSLKLVFVQGMEIELGIRFPLRFF